MNNNINKDDELLDLVDENDNIIGTVWRSEAHGNIDLIHREVAIAVFNPKGQVLIQRRSMIKKTGPGEWRTTAAGHVEKGQDLGEGIIREVEEELGIIIDPIYSHKTFSRDEKNKESKFYYNYYAVYNKDDVKIDNNEVMDAKWVDINQISDNDEEGKYNVGIGSYKLIMKVFNKLKKQFDEQN